MQILNLKCYKIFINAPMGIKYNHSIVLKATYSRMLLFMPLPFKNHSSLEEPSFSQLSILLAEKKSHMITALTGTCVYRNMLCQSQFCAHHSILNTKKLPKCTHSFPSFRRKEWAGCLRTENLSETWQLGEKGGEPLTRPAGHTAPGEGASACTSATRTPCSDGAKPQQHRRGHWQGRAGLWPAPAAGPQGAEGETPARAGRPVNRVFHTHPALWHGGKASTARLGASPIHYSHRDTSRRAPGGHADPRGHRNDMRVVRPPRSPLLQG